MTKILEAEITDLAGSKKHHHFRLDQSLNVFWGLNGSGKTSFLRILQSALINDASLIADVAFESARVVYFSEDYGATFERTLTKEMNKSVNTDSGDRTRRFQSDPAGTDSDDEEYAVQSGWDTRLVQGDEDFRYPLRYKHSYLPISRLNHVQESKSFRGGEMRLNLDEFNFENEIETAWRQYNSVSLVRIREIQQKGLADIISILFQSYTQSDANQMDHDSTIDEDEAHRLIVDFLVQQKMSLDLDRHAFISRYRDQPELQQVVHRIRDVNQEIDDTTRSQRAFQKVIGELYSGDKRIEFSRFSTIRVLVGRRSMSMDRLSSGEKQLLQILLATLSGATSPVLVDEPELSMHIDWQRQLVSCMQEVNPGCQLILATHSPEVVARIPDNQIFQL